MTQDMAADSARPKMGMRDHANFAWRFILFALPFFSAEPAEPLPSPASFCFSFAYVETSTVRSSFSFVLKSRRRAWTFFVVATGMVEM